MAKRKKTEAMLETASKKEVQQGKVLLMNNGKQYSITSETGKYYICGDVRFRKMNKSIQKVMDNAESFD